jgi:hypothetical protein
MPTYECCFLGDSDQIVRTETFRAYTDLDAHREVMTCMMRVGGFSGYELWAEGRKVVVEGPVKARTA